jgi:L-aspartate oxidase
MDQDVIVVGSGAAGISAALAAASRGLKVLLITKSLNGGATPLAQGGLAAAIGPGDDPAQHAEDTLLAGAGLCDPDVVTTLTAAAPQTIATLADRGARLDRTALRREGGHRRHRIVHSGDDATGAEVHRVLRAALQASPVEVLDHTMAIDLIPGGLRTRTRLPISGLGSGTGTLTARAIVLAAGGLGQAYAITTSPLECTGDAIALALRAGVEMRDPEFVQFHPTVLHIPGQAGQRPLITEALRGAGATLTTYDGRPLMRGRHPQGDLAPRDVVSAAMAEHLGAGDPHLWLDATALGRGLLESGFPTVTTACRANGIDPVTDPIPVAPGAHYYCGGIRAGLDGRTSLPGLYAVGEAASTGVQGANRLASNSVTEALIAGTRTGHSLELTDTARWDLPARQAPVPADPAPVPADPAPVPAGPATAQPPSRAAMAAAMSRYAGVLRDADGLRTLLATLGEIPASPAGDTADVEAANLRTVSILIATAALAREESRGCHRRSDTPWTYPQARHTVARWDGARLTVGTTKEELVASCGLR